MMRDFLENCPHNIKKYFVKKEFKKDETIILQGDTDRYIYFVVKGRIKVFCILPEGEEYVLTYLSAVDIIGEVESLVKTHQAVSMVKAEEDTEVLRLEKSKFIQWMKQDWEFAYYIMTSLAERIFYITENTVMRYITTVDERLAELLEQLKSEDKIQIEKSFIFNKLYTTRRSFNRALKKLCDQQVISVAGNTIIIK